MISGFLTHSRFYYYWLQSLSHFVVTNIRKFFQTSKFICKYFVNLIQALLRIPSEYYFHKKSSSVDLLRGRDSNPRPLGYEPNELPLLLPRDIILKNFYIVVFIYIQIYGKNSKIQNIFFNFFCGDDGNRTRVQKWNE